jgi:hypothetical protein
MIHSTRAPAIVLLVALAFLVGVPPPLFALDRPTELDTTPGSAETPPNASLVTNDGDPDEWSSNSGGEQSTAGTIEDKPGDGNDWLDYLESIRNLILRIKMDLDGIL